MTTLRIEEIVEKLGNDMSWINKPNYKDYLRQALTEAHQAGYADGYKQGKFDGTMDENIRCLQALQDNK